MEQDQFLVKLDAKIEALRALRESYVKALTLGAMADAGGDVSTLSTAAGAFTGGVPMELPRGAFLGKTLPAAIKLYLSAVKRKVTVKEIATALKEGGVETTSANFENPITSAVNRLKANGEVLRFNDGWALAEFYPEALRNRLAKDSKPAPKKKAKAKKSAQSKATKNEVKAVAKPEAIQPGLDQRITAYLQTRGQEFTTAKELMDQLKCGPNHFRLIMGKLVKHGKVEKNEAGNFRLKKAA